MNQINLAKWSLKTKRQILRFFIIKYYFDDHILQLHFTFKGTKIIGTVLYHFVFFFFAFFIFIFYFFSLKSIFLFMDVSFLVFILHRRWLYYLYCCRWCLFFVFTFINVTSAKSFVFVLLKSFVFLAYFLRIYLFIKKRICKKRRKNLHFNTGRRLP